MENVKNYTNGNVENKVLLFICMLLMSSASFAGGNKPKEPNCLKLTINLTKGGIPESNAYVKLYCGSQCVVQAVSSGQNKNEFLLQKNKNYIVKVIKPGFPEQVISVSTNMPDNVNLNNNVFTYEMQVEIPESIVHDKKAAIPAISLSFNKEKYLFDNPANGRMVIVQN